MSLLLRLVGLDLTVGLALRKAEASFWTAEEMDLSKDMHDWENKLNDNERVCLLHFPAPTILIGPPCSTLSLTSSLSLPLQMVSLTKTCSNDSPTKSKPLKLDAFTVSKSVHACPYSR